MKLQRGYRDEGGLHDVVLARAAGRALKEDLCAPGWLRRRVAAGLGLMTPISSGTWAASSTKWLEANLPGGVNHEPVGCSSYAWSVLYIHALRAALRAHIGVQPSGATTLSQNSEQC